MVYPSRYRREVNTVALIKVLAFLRAKSDDAEVHFLAQPFSGVSATRRLSHLCDAFM